MSSSNSKRKATSSISPEPGSPSSPASAESRVEFGRIKFEESLTLADPQSHQHGGDDIRIYEHGKGKRRKEFWNDFKRYRDKNNKKRAECSHCHKTFAADPIINGTKNLSRHWAACGERRRNKSKGSQSKLVLEKEEDTEHGEMVECVADVVQVREALIKMIAAGHWPFTHRALCSLKLFTGLQCPPFDFPSRADIARDCYQLYLKEKEELKELLQTSCQRVCLTKGTYISIQEENYASLTAHFIDNEWNVQKRVLNFCLLDTDGDELFSEIEGWLKSWNLRDKVFTVTVDSAIANDVACSHFRKMVIENGSCINQGKNLQVMCVAQIINMIVWGVLEEYTADLEKVRTTVWFFRNPDRASAFKEQVEKLGVECRSSLRNDVPTRWNSTYRMLDVALKYRDVFDQLEIPRDMDDFDVGHFTVEEWARIEMLVNFLKEFYDLTKRVTNSSEVTINTVFLHIDYIVRQLNEWAENGDPACRSMTLQMKMKCDKYWGDLKQLNMLFFVAIILDPSYKYRGLQVAFCRLYGSEEGDSLAARVKEFAYVLFSEYTNIYPPAPKSQPSKSSAPVPRFMEDVKRKLDEQDRAAGLITELDWYLHEPNEEPEQTDILTWWRLNAHRFPILAHMARDVLAIPLSTRPSEYAFSVEGCSLEESKSSLGPKLLQALVCTKDWLGRGSKESDSDEEHSDDDSEQTEKAFDPIAEGVFPMC